MTRLSTHILLLSLACTVLLPAYATARGELAAACRDDVQRLCPGVPPGGGRIGRCLREQAAKVSAPCKQAIVAMRARGGREQAGGACRDDVARLCPDAAGDRNALRQCVRAHARELSDGCRNALAALRRQRRAEPPAR